jgi:hypothetical protein
MPYNDLQATDTMIVNNGENSYSATVENVAAGTAIADTDVFLVNRGENSYSITKQQLSDEIGARGEIEEPVVVLTPPNGAGMTDQEVTPAAEGVTDVNQRITAVSYWNQGNTWSAGIETGSPYTGQTWADAFNGVVDGGIGESVYTYSTSSTVLELTYPPSWSKKIEVCIVRYDGFLQINDTQLTSELPTPASPEWVDITDFVGSSGTLNKVGVSDVSTNYTALFAIRLDGRVLVDQGIDNSGAGTVELNEATLTYTTDNNLSVLTVGQAMTQQPAYTPVTDTITTVTVLDNIYSDLVRYQSVYSGSPDLWCNGLDTDGSYLAGPHYADYWVRVTQSSPVGFSFSTFTVKHNSAGSAGVEAQLTIKYTDNTEDNYLIPVAPEAAGSVNTISVKNEKPFLQFELRVDPATSVSGTGYTIFYIEIDGERIIASGTNVLPMGSRTDLTFKTDQDLVNFRVGDVAQTTGTDNPAWNETQVWSQYVVSDTGKFSNIQTGGDGPENAFDNDTSTFCGSETIGLAGSLTFTPLVFDDSASYEVTVYSGIDTNQLVKITDSAGVTTELNYEGSNIWKTSANVNGIKSISVLSVSGSSQADIRRILVNDKTLVDAANVVSVVSTDDIGNNKLTVNGGTWSDSSGVPANEDQSQVWSDSLTVVATNTGVPSTFYSGYPAENFFTSPASSADGTDGICQGISGDSTNYLYKLAPAQPTLVSKFQVVTLDNYDESTYDIDFKLKNEPGAPVLTYTKEAGPGINNIIATVEFDPPQVISASQPIYFGMRNADSSGGFTWQYLSYAYLNDKLMVDGTGQTKIIGPVCQGTGEFVSNVGNTLELTNAGGRWCVDEQTLGVKAESDDTYTDAAPGWDSTTFQSANGSDESTTFSGEDCVLREITWTFQKNTGTADVPVWETPGTEVKKTVAIAVNAEVPALEPSPTLEQNTIYRVKVAYEADSSAGIVESAWNTFKTSGDVNPTVKMSGLRFDSDRETNLRKTFDVSSVHTFSFWVKHTSLSAVADYLFVGDGSNYIGIVPSGFIYSNGTFSQFTYTPTLNKWTNYVVTKSSDKVEVFVDGISLGSSANTANFPNDLNWKIGGKDSGGNGDFNGYMSDVYFVDGQVLPASTFGTYYQGLWGPLPSETVLNNITRLKSPYDQRDNREQKWSDNMSCNGAGFNGSYPATMAFDGVANSTNQAQSTNTGEIITWSFDATADNLSGPVRVYIQNNSGTITDGADNELATYPNSTDGWIELSGNIEDYSNAIKFKGNPGQSGSSVAAIEVDGRILADGPADNSQNWSDLWEETADGASVNNPTQGFDGDLSTVGSGSTTTTIDLSDYGFANQTVEWYNNNGAQQGANLNDEADPTGSGSSAVGWYTLGTVPADGRCEITLNGNGTSSYIAALRIGGKILVDSGAQWDQSEVWSTSFTCDQPQNAGKDLTNAFDGNLSTFCNEVTGAGTYTFVPTVSGDYRIRMYTNGVRPIKVDGATVVTVPTSASLAWYDIGSVTAGQTIIIDGNGQVGGSHIAAWEVDGKILVDSGSFGSSGFYLPFDPAQEGEFYSSLVTADQTLTKRSLEVLFDGSRKPVGIDNGGSIDNFTLDFTAANLTDVTKVEVGVYNPNDGSVYNGYNVNGGSHVDVTDGSTSAIIYSGASITLETINIKCPDPALVDLSIHWIKVNDELLIDHNNIGVDASGNGNNYHDENFAVGNTSQVWSDGAAGDQYPSYPVTNGFDGHLSTWSYPLNTNASNLTISFTGVTGTTFEVFALSGTVGGTNYPQLEINSVGIGSVSSVTGEWVDVSAICAGELTSLSMTTSGIAHPGFTAIRVDGQLLIDGNIQDTVVDTPVKNYSVLSGNSNGNLVNNNAGDGVWTTSTQAVSSGKYYAEFSVIANAAPGGTLAGIVEQASADSQGNNASQVCISYNGQLIGAGTPGNVYFDGYSDVNNHLEPGDVIGIAWDYDNTTVSFILNSDMTDIITYNYSGTGVTLDKFAVLENGPKGALNMGQQPFTNGTHNLEGGTVVLDGVTYSTLYQELAGYQVAGGYFYDEANQLAVRGSDLRKRFGLTSADPRLGIYDLTEVPNHQVIGYEKVGNKYQPLRDYTPEVRSAEAELTAAEATIRSQRQMIIRAACGWVVGKSYVAGDIVIFNGHVFKALTATTAAATNDPGDQTGDWEFLGLEEDTAPTTINGYYPLYTTEAASNAAGNGSSHTHTFDGVTYYMPDGGTTIYHGTYTGYSY